MALVDAKHPVRRSVAEAEDLLDKAKHFDDGNPKDRFAVLGQIWKWDDHAAIEFWAKRLAEWVTGKSAERGWLHTLLRLIEAREKEPVTTARLQYHVTRNYPRASDPDPRTRALRKWIDQIIPDFETQRMIETRFLPAIVRYALTATRPNGGDSIDEQ
jgi:hypothetical protein